MNKINKSEVGSDDDMEPTEEETRRNRDRELADCIIESNDENNMINDIDYDFENIDNFCEEKTTNHFSTLNEIDELDIESYLDEAIVSNLKDINFSWRTKCETCRIAFDDYQQFLSHILENHLSINGWTCTFEDCKSDFINNKLLSRHIVLTHCDLNRIKIYVTCPDCDRSFSDFAIFNKHSCCRNLTCVSGMIKFCKICDIEFPSYRRFNFHMQFHNSLHRPKICFICGGIFTNSEEFFEHVEYGHGTREDFVCRKCDRCYKDKSLYDLHIEKHKINVEYKCTYCQKAFFQKSMLTTHMCHFHTNILVCDICGKEYKSEVTLRKHLRSHEHTADAEMAVCKCCGRIANETIDFALENDCCSEPDFIYEKLSEAYTCEYCFFNYKSISDLKLHRLSDVHSNGKYECPLCKEIFEKLKSMRNHFKSHKNYTMWLSGFPLKKFFVCSEENCSDFYAEYQSYYQHRKRFHETHLCSVCKKGFVAVEDLEKHKIDCQTDNSYKCQFCDKECISKMSLAVHVARRHKKNNIMCTKCSSSFNTENELQNHIDHMHVEVECSVCNKILKNRRNLGEHERKVHATQHRYFCKVCNKGFLYKCYMEAHEKSVHTNVLYKCTKCKFITNYEKSLSLHMEKHNKNFQFKCDLCGKEFSRKQVLTLHRRRHFIQKQFICNDETSNGCNASYVTKTLLKKHIKKKHTETSSNKKQKRRRKVKSAAISNDNAADGLFDLSN